MESVWGGAQRVDLISILGVSDAGILGPQFANTPLCAKQSELGWAARCSPPSVVPRSCQSSPSYGMHSVLPLVVPRTGEIWEILLWPLTTERKLGSDSETILG